MKSGSVRLAKLCKKGPGLGLFGGQFAIELLQDIFILIHPYGSLCHGCCVVSQSRPLTADPVTIFFAAWPLWEQWEGM